jgi:hypothetical protein
MISEDAEIFNSYAKQAIIKICEEMEITELVTCFQTPFRQTIIFRYCKEGPSHYSIIRSMEVGMRALIEIHESNPFNQNNLYG